MRILVSAGPTSEPIDAVRCITNYSSGKTGYAIAQAAIEKGHEVVLVSGMVNIAPPAGARTISVRTGAEMLDALRIEFKQCDILIMAAAVCDYRPATPFEGKIKREGRLTLELEPTQDILAELAKDKRDRIVVGFALEADNGIERAREKCIRKNCDMVVHNAPSALCGNTTELTLVYANGRVLPLPAVSKTTAAELLLEEILAIARQ